MWGGKCDLEHCRKLCLCLPSMVLSFLVAEGGEEGLGRRSFIVAYFGLRPFQITTAPEVLLLPITDIEIYRLMTACGRDGVCDP